jgi:hypothetical protein
MIPGFASALPLPSAIRIPGNDLGQRRIEAAVAVADALCAPFLTRINGFSAPALLAADILP